MKHTYPEVLWAGTDHSLALAMEAHQTLMAGPFDGGDDEEDDKPYNYSLQGSVGVVSITGPLVNTDSPYNRYFGVTSYADIRRAMVYAAQDESVKAILLDIDSGGGAVSGVADTGQLISTIGKQIKPVYAFAGGVMASAAYWLGSSVGPGKVFVDQTTISGSIGVITTHVEYSKQLREAGVGVTVMRAGEYKALANSVEPLTEVAKNQLQDQLNAAYGIFIGHVAEMRGTTVNLADQTMGQGREFFGAAAVTAGLVDGIQSFDGMLSMIEKKVLDSAAQSGTVSSNFQRGSNMSRAALTEQTIAAMAAGGVVATVVPEVVATVETPVATVETAAPVVVAEVTETEKKPDAIVAFLQSQLKAANDELVATKVELASVKETLAGVAASHDGLMKIAAKSVSHMKVALGLKPIDLSASKPEALLAEHAATAEVFTNSFKVGGVAAVNAPEDKSGEAKEPDHLHMARINATRFSTHK